MLSSLMCLHVLPQGYHKDRSLGPLLFFLIYIDDITQVNLSIGNINRLVLYIDDMLLYCPIS